MHRHDQRLCTAAARRARKCGLRYMMYKMERRSRSTMVVNWNNGSNMTSRFSPPRPRQTRQALGSRTTEMPILHPPKGANFASVSALCSSVPSCMFPVLAALLRLCASLLGCTVTCLFPRDGSVHTLWNCRDTIVFMLCHFGLIVWGY